MASLNCIKEVVEEVLMVTHQVVISAITGINVGSGVAVAYSSWNGSAHKISRK